MCKLEIKSEKMSNPNPYDPDAQPNSPAQYPDAQGAHKRQTREDFLVNFDYFVRCFSIVT